MHGNLSQLTLFPMPLRLPELQVLFSLTDWGIVLLHRDAPTFSTRYSPESIFKVLLLPFLVSVVSDAALVRELEEKETIRSLCGLAGKTLPSARFLSSIRDNPTYPEIMYQLLIELAIASTRLNLRLPYLSNAYSHEFLDHADEGSLGNFSKTRYRLHFDSNLESNSHKTPHSSPIGSMSTISQGVMRNLNLPFTFRVYADELTSYNFRVDFPAWLHPDEIGRLRGKDTVTEIGSSNSTPYIACSILVTEHRYDREKILLAKRLNGFGLGEYGLPGGRCRDNETIQDCALRELFEETGLRLVESKPISIRITQFFGKPRVISIGALATKVEGIPKRNEELQHGKWRWYFITDLPTSLFLPTKFIVDDYRGQCFPNLTWESIEWCQPKK